MFIIWLLRDSIYAGVEVVVLVARGSVIQLRALVGERVATLL
jgi:hypothetical protein